MTKQEHNIWVLCTCYTLTYLVRQAKVFENGTILKPIGKEIGISELLPDLTAEELHKAIAHYNDEEYKEYRNIWWVQSDRECDIQTLCISYPLEELKIQRDNLKNKKSVHIAYDNAEILYTVEQDILEEAISRYHEEKYEKARNEISECKQQYGNI